MNCEKCGAELTQDGLCPVCGPAAEKEPIRSAQELPAEKIPEAEVPVEEAPAQPEKKKASVGQIVMGVIIAVLVLAVAVLAIVLLKNRQTPETPEAAQSDRALPTVSYTVKADELTDDVLNKEVARVGDRVLTNRQLAIYYWQQYYSFANEYSDYLPYMLDTTRGLDEQMFSETMSWQQMFLQSALDLFHSAASCAQEAEKAGFTLDEAAQSYLDGFRSSLEQEASYYGYESADAYVADAFGPGVHVEDYEQYLYDQILGGAYMESLVDSCAYTADDVSAYYDAHADTYEQYHIPKTDKPMVTIRHVLIMPDGTNEDGSYTDAAWEQCRLTAAALYDEWKSGETTEDSFAQLAKDHSADGNAASGGIYTDVYPGQMVQAFNDWCFDDARQPGDTGIVETNYGCHIIYFVTQQEDVYWYVRAEEDYLQDVGYRLQDETAAAYPMTETLENAAIVELLGQNN